MRCPSNERVQVVVRYAEVHVDSIEYILWEVLEDVLSHLYVNVAFRLVLCSPIANLYSGRVEGGVGVLVAGDQNNVSEPAETLHFADLVEAASLHVVVDCVGHPQLLKTDALAPRLQEPHACIDDRRLVVHVAQMWA